MIEEIELEKVNLTKLLPDNILELFPENLILAALRGSLSHNTFIPDDQPNSTDDIDLIGVFMAPVNKYIGLDRPKETVEKFEGKFDLVSYEFMKTMKMLLKGNPNVFTLLWLKEDHYLYKNFYGRALVDNRNLFVSKRVYRAFSKYGENELRNINKTEFNGYMGAKRKKLVEKYHYDVRHASHCIRLLTMGMEFAQTGKLQVYRTKDAQELIDIKSGKWKLEDVKELALYRFMEAEAAYKKCDLPEEPDYDAVNKMTIEIMQDYILGST